MPILFRTTHLRAAAAISVAAACAIAVKASAQVPAPLLIGPDRVGSAITYRLTMSIDPIAASGSIDRTVTRPAGAGSPRGSGGGDRGRGGMGRRGGGGGGMGRGRSGDSADSSSGPKSTKVTTKIAVDAHFGRNGQLASGTITETIQPAADRAKAN